MHDLEWPAPRRNHRLTGRSPGKGRIQHPAIAAQIPYASGTSVELWTCDVNLDGELEYLFVEGGRIKAHSRDDRLLWQSEICNPLVIGFHDLDASGREMCVVAVTNLRTLIAISGRTGEVCWSHTFENKTVMLTHSRVRAGPIHPELKGEQITVWPEGDEYGYLFSFEQGVRNGRLVWKNRGIGIGWKTRYRPNVLVGDLQGSGQNSIIVIQHTDIWIVDCRTGAVRWEIKGPNMRNYGVAFLHDVDRDGVNELVFVNDSVQLRVSVLKWKDGEFDYAWSRYVGYGERLLRAPYQPVQDIDGDGKPELMYTVVEVAAGFWQSTIADAATGAVKMTLDHVRILDSGDVDGDGRMELLLEDAGASETILARPVADGRLEELFRTSGIVVPFTEGARPMETNHTNIQRGQTYLKDADGDGRLELLVIKDGYLSVFGWKDGAGFAVERQADLGRSFALLTAFAVPGNGECCLLGKSEARLRLYTASGAVAAAFADRAQPQRILPIAADNPEKQRQVPLVADIDGDGIAEIMLGDAVYVWQDTAVEGGRPMTMKWRLQLDSDGRADGDRQTQHFRVVAVSDDCGDGVRSLLFAGPHTELVKTSCQGEILWRKTLNRDLPGGIVDSCAIGRFRSRDRRDIYANVKSANASANEGMLIDSDTGDIVWRRADGHEIGMGPVEGYVAVKPLEDDGLDDLPFLSGDTLMAIDGATGRDLIAKRSLGDTLGTEWQGFGQLTLVDADADGEDELYLSGVWGLNGGVLKLGADGMSPVWFDDYGNDSPIGTPPRDSHQGLAQSGRKALAGGQRHDFRYGCVDAATGELQWTYELGDRLITDTCTGDIDGDGYDEFVFGCNDGSLYALKYDGSLHFKLFIDGLPGHPVLADVDGDGWLEIVVTRSDGQLLIVK